MRSFICLDPQFSSRNLFPTHSLSQSLTHSLYSCFFLRLVHTHNFSQFNMWFHNNCIDPLTHTLAPYTVEIYGSYYFLPKKEWKNAHNHDISRCTERHTVNQMLQQPALMNPWWLINVRTRSLLRNGKVKAFSLRFHIQQRNLCSVQFSSVQFYLFCVSMLLLGITRC